MKRTIPALAAAVLGACLFGAQTAGDEKKPKKRLLVITESKGFVHEVVKRGKNGEPALAEKILTEIGNKSGDYEAVCSQNARQDITAENLKNFDAVFFYTTGDLKLSDTQKADLIAFIRSGKGFAGTHSATDTYYNWKEYGELVGGYFDGHPWTQKVKIVVEDTKHPATKHLGGTFEIDDEIYQFKAPYDRSKVRVLMRLDRSVDQMKLVLNGKKLSEKDTIELSLKEGKAFAKVNGGKETAVRNFDFTAPRGNRKDGDNAIAWVHEYGKGRVFYTALGHRPEVWRDQRYQKHVHGGLWYVLGLEGADATPSPAK